MSDDTIRIVKPIGDPPTGEHVFIFKKLTVEQAAQMFARLKSRSNYYEVIVREQRELERTPIESRDEKKYLALCDKNDSLQIEMGKSMEPLFKMIVAPDEKELLKIVSTKAGVELLQGMFELYFAMLFPTEAERKKS